MRGWREAEAASVPPGAGGRVPVTSPPVLLPGTSLRAPCCPCPPSSSLGWLRDSLAQQLLWCCAAPALPAPWQSPVSIPAQLSPTLGSLQHVAAVLALGTPDWAQSPRGSAQCCSEGHTPSSHPTDCSCQPSPAQAGGAGEAERPSPPCWKLCGQQYQFLLSFQLSVHVCVPRPEPPVLRTETG